MYRYIFTACLNKRSDSFCNRWIDDCDSNRNGQGDFMRTNCPLTCGVPCGKFLAWKLLVLSLETLISF